MSAPAEVNKTVATLATLPQLQQQAAEASRCKKPHSQWRPNEVEQLRFQVMRTKEQDIVASRDTAKKLSNPCCNSSKRWTH